MLKGISNGPSKKVDMSHQKKSNQQSARHSCLDLILSSVHVINLSEVVCAGDDRVNVARRLEVLCQVSVLTEDTHLEQWVS